MPTFPVILFLVKFYADGLSLNVDLNISFCYIVRITGKVGIAVSVLILKSIPTYQS